MFKGAHTTRFCLSLPSQKHPDTMDPYDQFGTNSSTFITTALLFLILVDRKLCLRSVFDATHEL